MSAQTDNEEEDCIVFEYPEDYVGTCNYVVVLDEPEESLYVDGKTEFFGCEYYEDFEGYIKLTTESGEAFTISKNNISKIINGESQSHD